VSRINPIPHRRWFQIPPRSDGRPASFPAHNPAECARPR
jgi:hypothetical protein